jgi:GT2 family glycosyltransferase
MISNSLIVVVIYEINLDDSLTLQSLIRIQTLTPDFPNVLVYDNSFENKYNEKYSENITYYRHDSANTGVGGAYNYAAKLANSINKAWLILFDQDTKINDDYLKELQSSFNTFPNEKLFCPNVLANNKIISPAYYFAYRAFSFNKPKSGILKGLNCTLINSGLAIKLSELENLEGYDTELPLDYSDHYFFFKFKKRNRNFVAINCENLHSLSSNSDQTFETVYSRFKKYCISTFIYAKKVDSNVPLLWLFFRTFKLTLKFSKVEFFKFLLFKK